MIDPIFMSLGLLAGGAGLAALWWPRSGLLARRRRKRENAGRIEREDALKHFCKTEAAGRRSTLHSLAGALNIPRESAGPLLEALERDGLLFSREGAFELTPKGRAAGVQVIRAHRLWECHLAENTGIHSTGWHAQAESREHWMSPEEVDALSAQLGNPTHDPHGDPIPAAGGELLSDGGRDLNTLAPGQAGRVIHLEDEPAALFAQLAALHLRPGMRVEVLEKNEQRISFTADATRHEIAPLLASQIEVLPLSLSEEGVETLASYQPGESATVLGLARGSHGAERRRLLDLGFVAGTRVEVEMISPSGEPTAYVVRGTVIALHHEQAQLVLVQPSQARP